MFTKLIMVIELSGVQFGLKSYAWDVTKTRNGEWGSGNGKLKMGNKLFIYYY